MALEGPKHKGVGVLAVVEALKANPLAQRFLPESLKHYLQDAILPSGWYPEHEYNVLLEALALGVARSGTRTDVWRGFGRRAAQRDIAGGQHEVPEQSRLQTAGVYRSFRDNDPRDLAGIFHKMERLWRLYHDSGRLSVVRSPDDPCSVLVRVTDFHFPLRGMLDLQAGYYVEYARLLGCQMEIALLRSVSDGHPLYEWRCSVERSAEHAAALAALPCDGARS